MLIELSVRPLCRNYVPVLFSGSLVIKHATGQGLWLFMGVALEGRGINSYINLCLKRSVL